MYSLIVFTTSYAYNYKPEILFIAHPACVCTFIAMCECLTIDNRGGNYKRDWKHPYIVHDRLLLNQQHSGIGIYNTFLCIFVGYLWLILESHCPQRIQPLLDQGDAMARQLVLKSIFIILILYHKAWPLFVTMHCHSIIIQLSYMQNWCTFCEKFR